MLSPVRSPPGRNSVPFVSQYQHGILADRRVSKFAIFTCNQRFRLPASSSRKNRHRRHCKSATRSSAIERGSERANVAEPRDARRHAPRVEEQRQAVHRGE